MSINTIRTSGVCERKSYGVYINCFLSIGLSLIVTLIGAILHLKQIDKMLDTYMENLNKVHERFLKISIRDTDRNNGCREYLANVKRTISEGINLEERK